MIDRDGEIIGAVRSLSEAAGRVADARSMWAQTNESMAEGDLSEAVFLTTSEDNSSLWLAKRCLIDARYKLECARHMLGHP